MLKVENLVVNYGAIKAIKGITLNVPEKSIITLIGANGAGKTTTLRAVSSIIRSAEGSKVTYEGRDITNIPPHKIVQMGVCQVPEGRLIFANLTVRENLDMGSYLRRDKENFKKDLDFIFNIFPILKERIKQPGGTLSGGEQQMLAISRALMSKPRMLLMDEPSLGIAPKLVKTIFEKIVEINKVLGVTILLVEQNAHLALSVANYGYVLETGTIILEGPAADLAANPEIRKAYLGEA